VEDDVRVVEGSRVVKRFRQIEIELTDAADAATLDALVGALRREGAGAPDPVPKNVRALGETAAEPEIAPPELHRSSQVRDLFRVAMSGSVERLIRFDAKLRQAADPRGIHRTRVAVRRMRSDLRTFAPILDEPWAAALREELRWLGDALSEARDVDVLLDRLRAQVARLRTADGKRAGGVLAPLAEARSRAYERIATTLRATRYVALVDALVEGAKRPNFRAGADQPAVQAAHPLLERVWRKLRKRVRRRSRAPSDRQLHQIRIKAKHVRYAAEAFSPVVGEPASAFARRVGRLQEILGEQHDAVIAAKRLREIAPTAGDGAFVAGELAILEEEAARGLQAAWRKSWRAIRRGRKKLFDALP
jgi:CHAD domain-containing protein